MSRISDNGTQTVCARTKAETGKFTAHIGQSGTILSIGSCFSTEMGKRLATEGYNVLDNPFGVLYNPLSIARAIGFMADGHVFGSDDVVPRDTNPVKEKKPSPGNVICPANVRHRQIAPEGGGFVSFYHHGSFARKTPEEFLENANLSMTNASETFRKAGWILVTFGTAWVYRHLERDMIVSNCHKHPAWEFRRERLDIAEITSMWDNILKRFPEKNFVFTVSPVRHKKDGMHGNQLSKAILLLAIEQTVLGNSNAFYFPAYEIVLDELRDYSWFAEDLVHPSQAAVNTVWERFKDTFLQ